MDSLPIGEYALLSDCRSAALVSRNGSVDWLCFPRFDGPSVFCRLLDPAAGHFAIRPAGEFQVSRRYVDQTLVLETTFTTARGTAVLTDALAFGPMSAATTWAHVPRVRCYARSPAPAARSRRRSTTRPGHSTGSSAPSWFLPPAASPHRAGTVGCSCPPRPPSAWRMPPAPPPSGSSPVRPPCSRLGTATCPARHWPRGPRRRSPVGWTTPWKAGGPGQPFTRTTRGRGGNLCAIPGACCRA
jgi:hypothetical protein